MVDEPYVHTLETGGPVPTVSWPDILNRVSAVSRALAAIGSGSEKDFMALGQSLMEGETAGRDMESRALGIVSLSQGDREKAALASMKDLVRQSLSRFLSSKDKTGQKIASVRVVLGHLGELQSKNGDIDRMARYAIDLLTNEQKYALFSQKARARAVEHYDSSIIVPQYERYYEKVLGS